MRARAQSKRVLQSASSLRIASKLRHTAHAPSWRAQDHTHLAAAHDTVKVSQDPDLLPFVSHETLDDVGSEEGYVADGFL